MEQPFYGLILYAKLHNTRTVTDPNDRTRRSNGSFQTEYEPKDFVEAIDELDNATTSAVADHLNCGKGTAHRWLNSLEADGEVTSKKIGTVVVWTKSK